MRSKSSIILSHTLLLTLSILITISTSIQIKQLNLQLLKQMRQSFDQNYNFIILDQQLISHLSSSSSLPTGNKIHYYTYNCGKDASLLASCSQPNNSPIILCYNKVIITYENYLSHLSHNQLARTIIGWIKLTIQAHSRKNIRELQILKIIQERGDVFIMVENKTINEMEIGYNILAKEFHYKDLVYLSDVGYAQSLNLTQGDFLHIKNMKDDQNNEDLQSIIANKNLTTFLPKQLNKRYDMMRLFVLENIFTRGLDNQLDMISQQRFSKNMRVRQLSKQGKYQQKRIVLIMCDLTFQCLKFWELIDEQAMQVPKQWLSKQNTEFKRMFYRSQTLKNIQLLQVYYHMKIRNRKLPFAIVFDGFDPQTPHLPIRYFKQLSLDSQNPLKEIQQTLQNIDAKKQQKIVLSSGIPKKNGYTGKGSEKLIQKLSYLTYKNVLAEAKHNKIFYLLYVTAFDFDCPQCLLFYSQFKKLASFLNAEGQTNIVFGVYDLSKDQIAMQFLESVPSVLLFPPNLNEPVEFNNRFQFEALHKFLKKEIQKDKQREVPIKNEEKSAQKNKEQIIQQEL